MSDKSKKDESTGHVGKGRPEKERLGLYAAAAIALLCILTCAILTPDYLNYRYRVAALKQQAQAIPVSGTNNVVLFAPPPAGDKSNLPGQEPVLKTADIYETYGKLITLLLGFVSVVGVLFGYFVRKSVRELTEDVRLDVQREVDFFKRERESALEKANEANQKAQTSLTKADALKGELVTLLASVQERLKALDEAIKNYQEKRVSPVPSTADTAAKVDQELGNEGV